MKAENYTAEFQSDSFKEYDRLLRELHRLENAGRADTDEADHVRNRMDAPYRNLSKNEIEHLRSLATSFNTRRLAGATSVRDVLSRDVEIKGTLKFDNELLIDCKFEGEIISDGVLVIGENADIRGEIKTRSAVVFGKVHGNISVSERCELRAQCTLQGDLKAARLIIEEGATFIGKSEIASGMGIKPARRYSSSETATEVRTAEPRIA